jgi:UDP-GlcNAc:undecaprenyl-phosphate/decaprenyl-phosphate GlcNAc-1-phosphate transferase
MELLPDLPEGFLRSAAILALAFVGTLALVKLLAWLALQIGLVDYPGRRKRHRGAIPLIGGPAILAGLLLGAVLLVDSLYPYRALLVALAILVAAGLLDDTKDLTPAQKFAAQLIAAACMVGWGQMAIVNLGDLFGFGWVSFPRWAVLFTVVALLGLINAINMADGADGLASGLALIALLFLAISALLLGRTVSAQMLFASVAAVFAFWIFNSRLPWQSHAQVFLGDSGSMMLGLLLTWFSVELALSGLPPIVAVWYLAVPLLDMGVVIGRRLGRGQSPFKAGRDHLHHVLIAAGLAPGTAVMLVHALALALAALAFFAWRADVPSFALFYAFLVLLAGSYIVSWNWRRLLQVFRKKQGRRPREQAQ